ncbi:hypothetical protein LOD99_13866 [Oopsacas minuta]|uniref:Shootin-1 n=1 Tax=Oopsacas minuta TaxID=111878 RepID=A0AAV7KM90_9METZ|nr:hypothetical protein LOD99_13866 [Oopsacas minuta]
MSTNVGTRLIEGTIATDNKMHQGIIRKNTSRFKSPPSPPPDPNSESKSLVIKRMKSFMQVWDKELEDIKSKKTEEDDERKTAFVKCQHSILKLSKELSDTCNNLTDKIQENNDLSLTVSEARTLLMERDENISELSVQMEYLQIAFNESELRRSEFQEQAAILSQQLQHSEEMRKRLHEEYAELQGKLAIEEQRNSKICSIM